MQNQSENQDQNEFLDQDQTSFSAQEPLLEDISLPQPPQTQSQLEKSEEEAQLTASKRKKIYFIVGLFAIVVLVTVVVSFLFVSATNQVEEQIEQEEIAVPTTQRPVTKAERELRVLQDRLEVIDPTREYLTPPPVNYQLRLE